MWGNILHFNLKKVFSSLELFKHKKEGKKRGNIADYYAAAKKYYSWSIAIALISNLVKYFFYWPEKIGNAGKFIRGILYLNLM